MATLSYVPAVCDLELYSGDGASVRIIVTDDDGAPVNIAGAVAAQVRAARADAAPLQAFAVDMTNAATGIAVISLDGDQTAALGDGFTGVWDVQWTAAGGEPATLMQGEVTCTLDVTRP